MMTDIKISEKYLEDVLFKKMEEDSYCKVLDEHVHYVERQVKLNNYGVMDIVTFDISYDKSSEEKCLLGEIQVTIYELKVTEFSVHNLSQITRYKDRVEDYLEDKYPDYLINVRGVIVCSDINPDSSIHSPVYIINQLDWLYLYTYSINIDTGLIFKDMSDGWRIVSDNNDQKYIKSGIESAIGVYEDIRSIQADKQMELVGK